MEKIRACFFTGHRRLPAARVDEIKNLIWDEAERLINDYDVRYFISGGALGFDTIAAETVAELRELYPHIRLVLYLPCYDQSKRWDKKSRMRYDDMLDAADDILYVTESGYVDGCMQKRNMRMIEDAFFCIAFCILNSSGTGATIRTAADFGDKVINVADRMYEECESCI